MDGVDADRAAAAAETGLYAEVALARLEPASCTPKNNLIVGVASEHRTRRKKEE